MAARSPTAGSPGLRPFDFRSAVMANSFPTPENRAPISRISQLIRYDDFTSDSHDSHLFCLEASDNISKLESQLFGHLPDPARLQERMGEYNGQVVFIGHPDRDVSAHQWSSDSFQWETLGRYAAARRKVEGSLASDCPSGYDGQENTVLYFKLAAEARERLVVGNDPAQQTSTKEGALEKPAMSQSQTAMLKRSNEVIPHGIFEESVISSSRDRPEYSSRNTTPFGLDRGKDSLDDVFVTDRRLAPQDPSKGYNSNSSMDMGYAFPRKASFAAEQTVSVEESLEILGPSQLHASVPDRKSQLIQLGERSGQALASTYSNIGSQHFESLINTSNKIQSQTFRQDSPEIKKATFEDQNLERLLFSRGIGAVSSVAAGPLTARSMYPSAGLTVANPYRVKSNNMPDSTETLPVLEKDKEDMFSGRPSTLTSRLEQVITRKFRHGLDFADDPIQQNPTPQNFKDPFFSRSEPSTHDPTAFLSTVIDENEKLHSWFHDGHRAARQREFANNLVSTAVADAAAANNKSRFPGTVETKATADTRSAYAHTGLFLRLYENFSEYQEEYTGARPRSYFTRNWAQSRQESTGVDEYNASGIVFDPVHFRHGASQALQRLPRF